jgi:Zn-dependent M28 family amino/carboxypeptidase
MLTVSSDDGSGTIGILAVAKALAQFRVKNAVRFAFWSAEEFGLLGSYHYMRSINGSETELAKIRAYLNFDMVCPLLALYPNLSLTRLAPLDRQPQLRLRHLRRRRQRLQPHGPRGLGRDRAGL